MTDIEVGIEELDAARREGVLVIDVRQPDEFVAGHVPGARLLPLDQVVDRVGEVPAGRPVMVICATGVRSLKAARFLRARGVDARSVAGGTKDWAESGRALETGEG